MVRLLLAVLLGALVWPSVSAAQAGSYYLVGLTEHSAWLADRDSIRWGGANPTITVHQIYRTPSPILREYGSGYDLYQRAEYRIEIDCAGRRTRDVGFTMHGFTASVRPIRMSDLEPWEPIEESTLFSDLHDIACSNRVPSDRTPSNDLQISIVAYYQTMNEEE